MAKNSNRVLRDAVRRQVQSAMRAQNSSYGGPVKGSSIGIPQPSYPGRYQNPIHNKGDFRPVNNEFFIFAMTTPTGFWRHPQFKDRGNDALYTSTGVTQRFSTVVPEMHDLWRRVAIDQVLPFDDIIDHTSLRLLRVKVEIEDVTDKLFDEPREYEHQRKLAALSRLSDEEAKRLGLHKERALYKLSVDDERRPSDNRLLRRIDEASEDLANSGSFIDSLR